MTGIRNGRHPAGLTFVEFIVAAFLASVVVAAAGLIYLTNQRSFRQGREKLLVQQNVSYCVEQMTRDIHEAWRADHVNDNKIVLYDVGGLVKSTWELGTVNGENRVFRNGIAVAPETCTDLEFTVLAPDTSVLGMTLELEDASLNRVKVESRAELRNFESRGPL